MRSKMAIFLESLRWFVFGPKLSELESYCGPWVDGHSEKELRKIFKDFKRRLAHRDYVARF